MKMVYDDSQFLKEIDNILGYGTGFLDGAKKGKTVMLRNVAEQIKDIVYSFIDSMARSNPEALHHVYEWYQVGSPNSRLYDIDYSIVGGGISFSYSFSQSVSVKQGSKVPFYDKARIMEEGIPVTIRPQKAGGVLAFNQGGQDVFTKKPITVENPGGDSVKNGFSNTIKMFFNSYLSQTMLDVTGIKVQLNDLSDFKKNFRGAKTGGYSLGVSTGVKWISKVGTIE